MDNYSLSLAINYLILFIREHLLSTGAVPRSVLRAGDKEEQVESDEVAPEPAGLQSTSPEHLHQRCVNQVWDVILQFKNIVGRRQSSGLYAG